MASDASGGKNDIDNRVVEIYKLYVETAERNIERRLRANQFFFSLITALFVAFAYLNKDALDQILTLSRAPRFEALATCVLSVLLMVISFFWYSVLLNFRALSAAKYRVILDIEQRLGVEPFTDEWGHYKQIRRTESTQIELMIPLAFFFVGVGGAAFWFWEIYLRGAPIN